MTRRRTSPRYYDLNDSGLILMLPRRFRLVFVSDAMDLKTVATFLTTLHRAFSAEVVEDGAVVLPRLVVSGPSEHVNVLLAHDDASSGWTYTISPYATRALGIAPELLVTKFRDVVADLVARLKDETSPKSCRSRSANREFVRLKNQLSTVKGRFAFRIEDTQGEERWVFPSPG